MSGGFNQNGKDESVTPHFPPLIKSMPASLRRHDTDAPVPRGDQSITLDEDDERILDKVWAEVGRHPMPAADPAAPGRAS